MTRLDSVPIPLSRHKKKYAACQVQLEYFKSYGPLSQAQADLMVMAAGIKLRESATDQLGAVIVV